MAYRRLAVRLQQAFEGGGDDGYGVQRGLVLVDPLQIGLDAATVFWGCRTLPPEADGIVTSRIQGQHGFEPKVTDPVIDEIVDVSEALPPMSAQRRERHVARISIEAGTARPRTATLLAVDTEVMQMHVAPAKTICGVAWTVARDMSLRMRRRRQISGLIPCTTTRN